MTSLRLRENPLRGQAGSAKSHMLNSLNSSPYSRIHIYDEGRCERAGLERPALI